MHPTAAGVDVIVARILPKVEELIAKANTRQLTTKLLRRKLRNIRKSAYVNWTGFVRCRQNKKAATCSDSSPVSKFPPTCRHAGLAARRAAGRTLDRSENYHLTLRFIGDVDDALAREVA